MKLDFLEKDYYYHIYNRGINGETVFKSERNKLYFLKLCSKYLANTVSVFAYCLMDNHFHLLVRIEEEEKAVTQSFSNLFNAYAKAFNKENERTGSLFEKHFKRIRIEKESYLRQLVVYIHLNPSHHLGIDFKAYPFSSYQSIVSNKKTLLKRDEVIELFETRENFIYYHNYRNDTLETNLTFE